MVHTRYNIFTLIEGYLPFVDLNMTVHYYRSHVIQLLLFLSETTGACLFSQLRVKEQTLCSRIVRTLLMDFSRPKKGLNIDQKKQNSASVKDWKRKWLLRIENESEELISLFHVIFQDSLSKGDRIFASVRWRDFVKILSSPCPLCSFLTPSEDFFSFPEGNVFLREKLLQNDVYLKDYEQQFQLF